MIQLKALILEREIMVLWVTHQTEEALSFADHIVLLQHGSVEQQGAPQELFFKPKSIFAAQFFGHQNLYAIHHSNHTSTWITPWGEHPLDIEEKKPEVVLVIPEESLTLGNGPYEGKIQSIQFLGSLSKVELESSAQIIVAKVSSRLATSLKPDQKISFNIRWADCFEIGCL
jgi:ABC-type sugar transport system ATPase subunit